MVAPNVNAVRPAGEWNRMRIKCEGALIEVELNDRKVVSADLDDFDKPGKNPDGSDNKFKYAWKTMPRKGHIGLQTHGSMDPSSGPRIKFVNLRLQKL